MELGSYRIPSDVHTVASNVKLFICKYHVTRQKDFRKTHIAYQAHNNPPGNTIAPVRLSTAKLLLYA